MPKVAVALLFALNLALPLQAETVLRISVENTTSHVQTKAVERFTKRLGEALGDRMQIKLYTGAELFRDQDVFSALARGRLEMAVPGTWNIEKLVPDVGIFLLPEFYGQPQRLNYEIMNSPLGAEINRQIEENLGVKVIGGWIDLAPALLFTRDKRIVNYEDIKGMRIRVAGGKGNESRIAALGGSPLIIAFPDLPNQLVQGNIEGVLTTYETVRSAKLWEYGLSYAFEDNQYFAQYVPMIAEEFWNRLPADIQNLITQTWQEGVYQARSEALTAQYESKNAFVSAGGTVYIPTDTETAATRIRLTSWTPRIAETIGIPAPLGSEAAAFISNWTYRQ